MTPSYARTAVRTSTAASAHSRSQPRCAPAGHRGSSVWTGLGWSDLPATLSGAASLPAGADTVPGPGSPARAGSAAGNGPATERGAPAGPVGAGRITVAGMVIGLGTMTMPGGVAGAGHAARAPAAATPAPAASSGQPG